MCRKTAQRYYRWDSGTTTACFPAVPSALQNPAAAVPRRGTEVARQSGSTAALPGSTAGIVRLKKKEPSGSTRQLPRGTVTNTESKNGLAVPLAVPPAVVPLAEASGTTRYYRQEEYQLCCRSPAPGGAVLPLRQRYYRQTQECSLC